MTVEFTNDRDDGIVVGKIAGAVTLEDLTGAAKTMWSIIAPTNGRVLLDLVDARFNLRSDEVAQLADVVRRGSPVRGLRVVFLVATDLEFGQVRMFEVLRGSEDTEMHVVRNREYAVALLRGTAGDAEPD
ncbi:MAG: hypothetical protein AAFN78_05235 [Pseudomonadota bacterium]